VGAGVGLGVDLGVGLGVGALDLEQVAHCFEREHEDLLHRADWRLGHVLPMPNCEEIFRLEASAPPLQMMSKKTAKQHASKMANVFLVGIMDHSLQKHGI